MSLPTDTTTQSLDDLYSGTLKNSLKSHINYHTTVSKIAAAITQLPEYQRLKNGSTIDTELVHVICNITEDLARSDNVSEKTDKKQLVLDAFNKVFPLNPSELLGLENQIQYLFNNGLIKRSKIFKKVIKKIKSICFKLIK
jgi:hypothetical protein